MRAADALRWCVLVMSACSAERPAAQPVPSMRPSPGVAVLRPCAQAGRDPEVGFCDATARWQMRVQVMAEGPDSIVRTGVTAADFDGDGLIDLFFTRTDDAPPMLFLRRGEGWVESAAAWGLGALRGTLPSAAADLDGDGDQDLVVGTQSWSPVRVYRNEGGRFDAVAALGEPEETAALAPADLDRDGRLDLLVASMAHPGACEPQVVQGCPTGVRAWRQTAPWRFEAVTVESAPRRAQAVRLVDWDGDGRDEVLVGADYGNIYGGNQILRIDTPPGGGFALRDATAGTGFDHEIFAMGIGMIDVDGDGRDEALLTNLGRNVHADRARDRAVELGADAYGVVIPGQTPRYRAFDPENRTEAAFGRFQTQYFDTRSPAMPTTKWTPVVFDFDDDGISDVYIPAGAIGFRDLYPEISPQQSALLRGDGRQLTDVTVAMHASALRDANAALAADLDGDGDLDLAVAHTGVHGHPGGLSLLRNDASRGASLTVVARGRGAARDGIGALVTVRVGARTQRQRLDGNLSIFGSALHAAHFGLGPATRVDEVTVRFPSGVTARRTDVPAGRVVIEEE